VLRLYCVYFPHSASAALPLHRDSARRNLHLPRLATAHHSELTGKGISYNGTLRHEYRYSATANDGKITSYKNWQSGEDVQYQYDTLGRLASATTVGPEWGQSYGYDGWGNLLLKTVTKGTATLLRNAELAAVS
jgi:YD repeat-containing protein